MERTTNNRRGSRSKTATTINDQQMNESNVQKLVKQETDQSVRQDDEDEEDIFKILITTDNHLGFREDDKIVGNDSFYAFNEALQM